VYAPRNTLEFLNTSYEVSNSTVVLPFYIGNDLISTEVNFTLTNTSYSRYRHSERVVRLEIFHVLSVDSALEYPYEYPTCFRPDIGGDYEFTFKTHLINTMCPYSSSVPLHVTCGVAPSLVNVPETLKVTLDRHASQNVTLNASDATDADSASLIYNWVLVFPSESNRTDWRYTGYDFRVPTLVGESSKIATLYGLTADMEVLVDLYVSDGCSVVSKRITIFTACSLTIPEVNTTLVTVYDGTVPIPLMSVAYDYQNDMLEYKLPYSSCQHIWWNENIEYSQTIPDQAINQLNSGSTPFVKTAGFAGLIAAIVIVGVTVPVILYLYFAKKACFKSTDPRI
jgi:hypothetical protein